MKRAPQIGDLVADLQGRPGMLVDIFTKHSIDRKFPFLHAVRYGLIDFTYEKPGSRPMSEIFLRSAKSLAAKPVKP